MAAWEDLENDSNEEEESEGDDKDCFMAGNNNLDEVNYYDLTIEDLHAIIDDLTLNTSKLLDKYNECRSERDVLRAENEFLKEKVKETECALDIIEENRFLKSELEKLKGKHIVDPSHELIAKNKRLNDLIKFINNKYSTEVPESLLDKSDLKQNS